MADDFLTAIGRLLGIAPQPAIAGPANPAQAAPAAGAPGGPAPSGGGLTGFLSNPLVEGALGAGLGYLAQPRGGGLMRRLGVAGLTGLEGFSEAERQELAIPQAQATLAKTQAETKEATAKAGMTEAEAQYYKQHPEAVGAKFAPELYKVQQIKQANTTLAASWMDAANRSPGVDRERVKSIAMAAAASGSPLKFEDLTKGLYGDKEALARIQHEEAGTGAELARTVYTRGETGLLGPRAASLAANTAHSLAATRFLGANKPSTDAAIQAAATRQAEVELGPTPPPGIGERLTGANAAAVQRKRARIAEIAQQLKAQQRNAGLGVAAGGGGGDAGGGGGWEPAPEGSTEEPL